MLFKKIQKCEKKIFIGCVVFCMSCRSAEALNALTHLDCSLRFNEPSPQHRLHVSVTEILVGLHDLTLDHLLQQEPPQTPVEERPRLLPV